MIEFAAPFEAYAIDAPPLGVATGPMVFASPHSGDHYPDDFRPAPGLTLADIRAGEDALVDRFIACAPALGAPVIAGRIGRAYLDLNRAEDELDPVLIDDVAEGPLSARIAAGLGVVPRLTAGGRPLYDRRLSRAEAEARVARWSAPYHAALAGLLERALADHGHAVLVDWHSMPAVAARGGRGRPTDVVLGDRHGTACAAALIRRARAAFERQGWRVALNAPFAGGHTTALWGRPSQGVHALQIEVSRALYLDAQGGPSAGFDRCRAVIGRVAADLADPDFLADLPGA